MIHKWFTGDSENDLKINIFLAAVESAVDGDADLDTDMVFKDPALFPYNVIIPLSLSIIFVILYCYFFAEFLSC